MIDLKVVESSASVVWRLQHRSQYRMAVFELLLWHIHEKTGLLWWIGFQTCNFERGIVIWLPSFLHILIFSIFFFCYNIVLAPFKLALKVSKLTISFVSSLELVRQVQAFLPKGKSPQEEQKSIKIQKKTICKKNANIPCLAAMILIFEALFPKKISNM